MPVEPAGLEGHLLGDLGQEPGVARVHRAGKHGLLPQQDPGLVAGVVESVLRVEAPAPDAEHVHVGVRGLLDEEAEVCGRRLGREDVERDHVGPLGVDGHAVDREIERFGAFLAVVQGVALELDGAEADAASERSCG